MKPPYTLSPVIVNLCSEIGRLVGQYEGLKLPKPQPQLRRKNKIKSIQGSLAIEGNTLSPDQVTAILENKEKYYRALRESDQSGDSGPFIEFCLNAILESLKEFLNELKLEPLTPEARLEMAKTHFQKTIFSRKEYLNFFKTLSTATASRDLKFGVARKWLTRTGDKALAKYSFQPTIELIR